jgi:dihydroorotate dehydrogenase (NAD+) catalytic subunit
MFIYNYKILEEIMIDLNGITVKNPFFIASGPAKYGQGYDWTENPINAFFFKSGLIKPEMFGGMVTKTFTIEPRKGNYSKLKPWQVLKPVRDGWLNRFGWNNCGIGLFINKIYPKVKLNNLIPSIGALKTGREFLIIVDMLNKIDILAIEWNISCPHVDILFRHDLKKLANLFKEAVKRSRHHLIVKLGAIDNPVTKAKIAEECGIKAVSAINTIPAYYPGFGDCGKSGPAIKETALKTVEQIVKSVNIPVIGGGGIDNMADCQDFFNVGAKAVFFSSVFLTKPWRPSQIVKLFNKKINAH